MRENIVAIIICVLSYAFQVSGALILLQWCISGLDKKVKQACIDLHSGSLWIYIDTSSGNIQLSKEDLRESAKNIYANIAAFIDLIIGYSLAIFISDVPLSPWCILVFVLIAIISIVFCERHIINFIAIKKYNSDSKIDIDECSLRPGTMMLEKIECNRKSKINSIDSKNDS